MRHVVASVNLNLEPSPHRFNTNQPGGGGTIPVTGESGLENEDGKTVLTDQGGNPILNN
jgi:hypothetical protein